MLRLSNKCGRVQEFQRLIPWHSVHVSQFSRCEAVFAVNRLCFSRCISRYQVALDHCIVLLSPVSALIFHCFRPVHCPRTTRPSTSVPVNSLFNRPPPIGDPPP